ncbi:hypothetical protein WKH44_16120 [Pantoea agglomerans]|jgi:hypothetical protein|uniref:Lipopolysaccharide assembly protein A domain-containing protein n=1 Tax=[Curtobacterium] plantarum TaxID=221276 RepID=A0ABT9T6B8_9GAMM|nr:hypothetical protein [[Curtobacterium] plantarum]MDQ0019015.1 hypothetical protein [[Curtobacterium] plantarum]
MSIKNSSGETIITWQVLLIVISSSLGIFFAGAFSGYFVASKEYSLRATKRDQAVNEIKNKVDQLPQQINRDIREEEKR